jgi:ubiquinone/menaquinone biosynthesis C-methylase UbiE
MPDEIKSMWEDRARQSAGATTATTNDMYLRELEIKTLVQTLRELGYDRPSVVLDLGCGDGYSTVSVAKAFPPIRMLGIDYSENMVTIARKRLAEEPGLGDRVRFEVGDATDLRASLGNTSFDLILTDRCLINLPSAQLQADAIRQIARHIRPGGHYVAIENFVEGQDRMNQARAAVGLPEIPVRWHNLFFEEERFTRSALCDFDLVAFKDFSSSYYFATRVIYSAMCKMRGEEPDYEHEIHRLSINLPWTGQFSPIRMAILKCPGVGDTAASDESL